MTNIYRYMPRFLAFMLCYERGEASRSGLAGGGRVRVLMLGCSYVRLIMMVIMFSPLLAKVNATDRWYVVCRCEGTYRIYHPNKPVYKTELIQKTQVKMRFLSVVPAVSAYMLDCCSLTLFRYYAIYADR
jgi:hypothetical protein